MNSAVKMCTKNYCIDPAREEKKNDVVMYTMEFVDRQPT